ncbi:MAG: capsule biosynthesis protein, partial [Pedobacter sp.]
FKEGATPNRIEISRRIKNSDATSASTRTAEVFTVNVDQNLKIQDNDFILKPFDIVSIRSSEGYQVQRQVKLEGEVLYPGTYTITRKDERISDVIKRAGGLTPLAYAEGASLKRPGRNDVNNPDSLLKKEEERYKLLNLRRLQHLAGNTHCLQFLRHLNNVSIFKNQILTGKGLFQDLIQANPYQVTS